jgi:hypothetical protein
VAKAIVFYEDLDAVVRALWTDHLKPALTAAKGTPPLIDTVNRKYVHYYQTQNNRAPKGDSDVATETIQWLRNLPRKGKNALLEKVVFLTDLAPEAGKTTPDTAYGIRVITRLASDPVFHRFRAGSRKGDPLTDFLADQRFVVILNTVFPDHARRCVKDEWPTVTNSLRICTIPAIGQSAHGKAGKMASRVRTVVNELKKGGPRVLLADRIQNEEFLAHLIVEVLR